jgi:hypothetical protein
MNPESQSCSQSLAHRGYFRVPAALSPETVSAFRAQLCADLHSVSGVDLSDASTWPRARERRVLEVEPLGDGGGGGEGRAHWRSLRESAALRVALDDALGADAWEILCNEGSSVQRGARTAVALSGPRHFYAPIVFPEGEAGGGGVPEMGGGAAAPPGAAAGRACPFEDYAAFAARAAAAGALEPAARWTPVSRRRFAGKGWHIDSGPGFGNAERRALAGDARQGAVLLVALSDWAPGGGGTAVVCGSHAAVRGRMAAEAAAGGAPLTHEALNSWVVARMRALAEAGRVRLLDSESAAAACGRDGDGGGGGGGLGDGAVARVAQLCARAGDIFILHPLLVHCGTSNEAREPRLMLNGMARTKQEAFARDGGVRTMLLLHQHTP